MDHETVAAYLDRIGVSAPVAGDAAGLRTLHLAHQLAVPFENLSIHLAEPVSLAERDLIAKVVHRAGEPGRGPSLRGGRPGAAV
jgi:N-hydroxyarylamine O-acetyltransferase